MTRAIEAMRRQVARAAAGARAAFRGVLTGLQLAPKIQLASGEGLAGEQLDRIELLQQFGFTSAPPTGSQLIVVPLGGRSSASVIVATEHGAYRFELGASGEACVYNQWGDFVHLRQDRTMHLVAEARVLIETNHLDVVASGGMNVTTPKLTVSGDIQAGGDVADAGGAKTMRGMRQTFDAHRHAENDNGGPTNPPATSM
ncbi:MAG: phage baseplate assembly protein V [Rubrivivax sp.]